MSIYRFGEFTLDVTERMLLSGGTKVAIEPKPLDVLIVLVSRSGQLVTKGELLEAVWTDTYVNEEVVNSCVSVLRKVLGDSPKRKRYIETVSKGGYRFVATVEFVRRSGAAFGPRWTQDLPVDVDVDPSVADSSREESTSSARSNGDVYVTVLARDPAGGPDSIRSDGSAGTHSFGIPSAWMHYGIHVITTSLLYALLFAIALFVEVAYDYERLGHIGWRLAPWIFGFIVTTMALSLWADLEATRRRKAYGLMISLPVIIISGIGLAVCVGPWLPVEAVTRASISTYTAQTAFTKSACYFIPLAILYVALPFHLIAALDAEAQSGRSASVARLLLSRRPGPAPRGAVHLKVWWLVVTLGLVGVFSAYGISHPSDNLEPDSNTNLFMWLYLARIVLYFLLAFTSLVWFHLSLNRIGSNVCVPLQKRS